MSVLGSGALATIIRLVHERVTTMGGSGRQIPNLLRVVLNREKRAPGGACCLAFHAAEAFSTWRVDGSMVF